MNPAWEDLYPVLWKAWAGEVDSEGIDEQKATADSQRE